MGLEQITPLIAIIISIIVFAFSVKTWKSQVKHNNTNIKLQRDYNTISLRPSCFVELHDYENCISVILVNNGLGSAAIDDLIITNMKSTPIKIHNVLVEYVTEHGMSGIRWTDFVEKIAKVKDSSDRVIPANGKINLLKLDFNKEIETFQAFGHNRDFLRNILKDITIEVKYRDFYNNHYCDCKRDCSFFGRNLP